MIAFARHGSRLGQRSWPTAVGVRASEFEFRRTGPGSTVMPDSATKLLNWVSAARYVWIVAALLLPGPGAPSS